MAYLRSSAFLCFSVLMLYFKCYFIHIFDEKQDVYSVKPRTSNINWHLWSSLHPHPQPSCLSKALVVTKFITIIDINLVILLCYLLFFKGKHSFSTKSSWSELVSTRRSTPPILPLQSGFPGLCQTVYFQYRWYSPVNPLI